MLNIQLLTSGMIYYNTKSSVSNIKSTIKDKKLEYYRLSCGFKDANNKYLNLLNK